MDSYTRTLLRCMRTQAQHIHRLLEELDAHIAADRATTGSITHEFGNQLFARARTTEEEEHNVTRLHPRGP